MINLLGSVSHEIRTPLNLLINLLEILQTNQAQNINFQKLKHKLLHPSFMCAKLIHLYMNDLADYYNNKIN